MKTIWKARTSSWRERPKLATPQFAVVRHAERADAAWHAEEWLRTAEGMKWPNDPPLTELGLSEAKQTAVEVCLTIGPSAVLLLDYSIGEEYGPDVFGDVEPAQVLRPVHELQAYCQARGVKLRKPALGKMPTWPEFSTQARVRFLDRFLRYLRRSTMARRNFTLVLHADGVATALSAMPAMKCRNVEHVGYAGFFVAILPASRRISGAKSAESVTPVSTEDLDNDDVDAMETITPCLSATCGWQVHVSSNVRLGPRVSEGLFKRISRWSRQTRISETSIQRLLRCMPKETTKESRQTQGNFSTTLSTTVPEYFSENEWLIPGCEKASPGPATSSGRLGSTSITQSMVSRASAASVMSGSNASSISHSTFVFGSSDFAESCSAESGSVENGSEKSKSPRPESIESEEKQEKAEGSFGFLGGLFSPKASVKSSSTPKSPASTPTVRSPHPVMPKTVLEEAQETQRPAGFLQLSGSLLMQRRRAMGTQP